MRATAKGALARCPAYVPHSASCCRVARSRMAMKCQGCVFFELCARLPAFSIERIASSDRGSSLNWRTARFVRITSETVMLEYLPVDGKQRSKRKPLPPEARDLLIVSRYRSHPGQDGERHRR